MRSLTVTFCVLLVSGLLIAGASAQTATPPAAPGSSTSNPTDRTNDPAPKSSEPKLDGSTRVAPSPNAPDVTSSGRDDSGSASPRTTTDGTRIFGMNPTLAAVLAAAILIVAILAIVAMARGRSNAGTRVDVDRKF